MVQTLDTREEDFPARFEALLGMKRESSADVNDAVAKIIADVRARGDEALIDFTQKFDQLDLRQAGIAVTEADI
ncbi:MAG TPA: histidinol dehydrogenase, partial [Methyloceanibacter sp.]|nr:histidinol dehydrogenase [Methyloceanibacter sp.]